MKQPFKTYNGGKSGSGVYQAIINQIPPHDIFISGFAGNCGVLANIKRAPLCSIAIDVDAAVVDGWKKIPGITAINQDFIEYFSSQIRERNKALDKKVFFFWIRRTRPK